MVLLFMLFQMDVEDTHVRSHSPTNDDNDDDDDDDSSVSVQKHVYVFIYYVSLFISIFQS